MLVVSHKKAVGVNLRGWSNRRSQLNTHAPAPRRPPARSAPNSLIKIGESLHCTLPPVRGSVLRLFDNDPLARYAGEHHLVQAIRAQVAAGADYLDVNVDDLAAAGFTPEQTADALRSVLALVVQHGGGVPPCIDSADPRLLEAGLRFYYKAVSGAGTPVQRRPPLLNSIAASRLEPLALRSEFPFAVIAMLLEKVGTDDGRPTTDRLTPPAPSPAPLERGPGGEAPTPNAEQGFSQTATAFAYWQTARYLFLRCREAGFAPGDIVFDPTVGPLSTDYAGYTRQIFEGIRRIRQDPDLAGCHIVLGLSNCSEGLPRRRSINRAYLRVAMEYGADAAILDGTRVTGAERVHPWSLRLVRQVIAPKGGDPAAALERLADYCAALPRPVVPSAAVPVPNTLAEALATPGRAVYTAELVPAEGRLDQFFRFAQQARDSEVVVTLTDSAGGVRAPSPDPLAVEVARLMGRQPVVNVSCKSEDRDGLLKRLLALYQHGLRNVFAVTGDYPRAGRAVFDLDSVGVLLAIWALKTGLDFPSLQPRASGTLPDFYAGAAVCPFKYTEGDVWGQRIKTWKKWRAGASYFIAQVGYDVKKFHELRLWMARDGMGHVPVLGNVYVLHSDNLLPFVGGRVPGTYLPPDLRDKYWWRLHPPEQKRVTRGLRFTRMAGFDRAVALRRAALLADVLVRGLGYRGVHFGGLSRFEDLAEVLAIKDELAARDWRENYEEYRAADGTREMRFAPEGTFYLFPEGGDGLLRDGPIQTADRARYPCPPASLVRLHRHWFEPEQPGSRLLKRALERSDREGLGRLATFIERTIKTETLGCEMCGDCRLQYLQFRCPEPVRGCIKSQINGPCGGGTVDGMCEVDAQRPCYWRLVVESALATGTVEELYQVHLPRDPALRGSSSWRNHLLGRTVPPLALRG